MCLYQGRDRPVDMWTSPHPCGAARAEPCGQPMDRAEASAQNASTAQARPTGCPHSRASRPHTHRPCNKLLLKKSEEVERRHAVPIVDRSKHISPSVSGPRDHGSKLGHETRSRPNLFRPRDHTRSRAAGPRRSGFRPGRSRTPCHGRPSPICRASCPEAARTPERDGRAWTSQTPLG